MVTKSLSSSVSCIQAFHVQSIPPSTPRSSRLSLPSGTHFRWRPRQLLLLHEPSENELRRSSGVKRRSLYFDALWDSAKRFVQRLRLSAQQTPPLTCGCFLFRFVSVYFILCFFVSFLLPPLLLSFLKCVKFCSPEHPNQSSDWVKPRMEPLDITANRASCHSDEQVG